MPTSSNIILDNTHEFKLIFNINSNFDLTLNNQHEFNLTMLGFTQTDSLFLYSYMHLESEALFKRLSKMGILESTYLETISALKMNKKINIETNDNLQSIAYMRQTKKIASVVKTTLTDGKYTLLGQLDNYTLGELDNVQYLGAIDSLTLGDIDSFELHTLDAPLGNYTLGYLDVGIAGGVNFIAGKKMISEVKNTLESTSGFNLYSYATVGDHDNLTLGEMDGFDLKWLDFNVVNDGAWLSFNGITWEELTATIWIDL